MASHRMASHRVFERTDSDDRTIDTTINWKPDNVQGDFVRMSRPIWTSVVTEGRITTIAASAREGREIEIKEKTKLENRRE